MMKIESSQIIELIEGSDCTLSMPNQIQTMFEPVHDIWCNIPPSLMRRVVVIICNKLQHRLDLAVSDIDIVIHLDCMNPLVEPLRRSDWMILFFHFLVEYIARKKADDLILASRCYELARYHRKIDSISKEQENQVFHAELMDLIEETKAEASEKTKTDFSSKGGMKKAQKYENLIKPVIIAEYKKIIQKNARLSATRMGHRIQEAILVSPEYDKDIKNYVSSERAARTIAERIKKYRSEGAIK